ncbi:ATP-binding protein [Streptomyces sp. NPDC002054]|uniref:ATP-binding protein n=1 Tax=Streptomyces sp. NPDC002054 TaxID=3154663 RepID=UPI003326DD94
MRPDTGDRTPSRRSAVGQRQRRRRRLALRGSRRQVAGSREFARQALRDWGWDGNEAGEDALVLVSELVTNACLYAGGCHEVVLTSGDAFRVEVFDGDTTLPRPPAVTRRGTPGGHGLHIVQRLADRWGTAAHGGGKVVWAEIDATRLTAGPARAAGAAPHG